MKCARAQKKRERTKERKKERKSQTVHVAVRRALFNWAGCSGYGVLPIGLLAVCFPSVILDEYPSEGKEVGGFGGKKQRRKGGGGKTEANTEVRDEKGKILFSFHVIKYLLCFHMSPTDRHSGLKEHYRDCWTATQSYWPRPSLLRTRLRCTALTV